MNKFSEILEKQIKNKAELEYQKFRKELEALLNKNGLPRDVIFDGLRGHFSRETPKTENSWNDRVIDIFIKNETNKFLNELLRLEGYFNNKDNYRF